MLKPCQATGWAAQHLPPGKMCEDILVAIRLGQHFRAQQTGRKPGFLHRYIVGIVARMERPTFDNLLSEFDLRAAARDAGDDHEPIERVSRSWELLTYHDPRKGEVQITFKTLRDYLTAAKKLKNK